MKRAVVRVLVVGAVAAGFAQAEENLLPPDAQIEQAVRKVWVSGGNRVPLCAAPNVMQPDQQGSQELEQVFAPGQWVLRLAQIPRRHAEIAQLDHFAKFGLLERREAFINLGPIRALPAVEYRPTLAGWAQSLPGSESGAHPCFYYGMAQVLKVLGYSESARDEAGFSRVAIYFLVGADGLEAWASTPTAADLFPVLRQERKGRFDFHRGPDARLRISPSDLQTIDEKIPRSSAAVLPGIAAAREGIERTRALPNPNPGGTWPRPCLALLSADMPQLWKEGDAASAAQAILPPQKIGGSVHKRAVLAHARLSRLERAGLVSLREGTESGQLKVEPSQNIRPLLARHGNCLPLGKVRIEVLGVLRENAALGERQRFKARYVVEEPAAWIKQVRNTALLPDLAAILRHGQPFEGINLKTKEGWIAAYPEDRRPQLAFASLTAAGVSPDWKNTTERTLAAASVLNHELHVVEAYAAPTGRIDVLVKKRPRPMVILLRGHEAIDWHLRLEKDATVDAVLAVGYHHQRVSGLPGSIAVVSAHAGDGDKGDAATTLVGRLDRKALASQLGVEPTSVQRAEEGKVVVDAPQAASGK